MKIKSILSIGGNCAALYFTKLFNLRYQGPVDNLGGNICITNKLFNGEFQKTIENNTYKIDDHNFSGKFPYSFYISDWHMVHNDLKLQKVKNELLKRIDNFNKYIELAKTDKSLFFIYATNWGKDCEYSKNEIDNAIQNLPKYIVNKLLIIDGCTFGKFELDTIPIYHINHELITKLYYDNNENEIQLFKNEYNNWWQNNKKYYEDINQVTYDLL